MADAQIVLSAEDRTARVIAGLKANLGSVSSEVSTLARGFGLLGPAIVGGLSGAAIVGFVHSLAAGLDQLNDVKAATGASIENLSALEDVAARNGISFDTVSTALIKFNKALTEGKPDSDVGRVLRSLGLDAEKLKASDPAEALRQTAVALAGFADDGNKARATQELFGKSLAEVAPLLKELSETGELNATVTTAQAEEAKKFNDQLSQLAKNATDTGRSIFATLVPALNSLFERIKSKGGIGGLLKETFSLGVSQIELERTQDQIAALNTEAQDLTATLAQNGDGGTGGFIQRAIGSNAKERLQEVRAELQRLQADEKRVIDARFALLGAGSSTAGQGRGNVNPQNAVPRATLKIPDAAKKPEAERISDARRELAQYVDTQQKQLEGLQQLTEEQQALNLLQHLGSLGEIPQVRELVLELAKKQETLKQEAEARKEIIRLAKEEADAQRKLDEQLEGFSGRIEEANKRALTSRLEERLLAGEVFSDEELNRIVRGIGGVREETAKANDTAEQMGQAFGSAFEGAIIGGKGLKDTLKGLEQDILRITTRKLITEPIAGGATDFFKGLGSSGGGGGLGAFFANLFGPGGSSGQFGTGISGFAVGSDFVTRDQLAFIHRGEKIIPAAENRRGGNAPQITINMNGSGGQVDRATIAQLQAAVGLATSRAMRRNL
jgi:hypothetical protein